MQSHLVLYVQSGNPFGLNSARYMAYCGVALYESVVPGMPGYQTLYGQLINMPSHAGLSTWICFIIGLLTWRQ